MKQWILSGFADEIDSALTTQMNMLDCLGISHIEMRNVNGKNLVQHSLQEVKILKSQMDSRGFKLSAVGSPIGKINITDDFGPHLDLFKHTLEIAAFMEAPFIRMFSFYIPKGQNPDAYRSQVLERWQMFLEAASAFNLTLLHENEKGIYGDTPERCLDLLNALESQKVAAVFDPANFIQCNVETYPYAYLLLKEKIRYFHIKDALVNTGQVVPAGFGDGKLPEILKDISSLGFNGFLSLEPHLGSYDVPYTFFHFERPPLPKGKPYQFHIAFDALVKVLYELEKPD